MRTRNDSENEGDHMEHRWGQRVPLEMPIRVEVGGRPMGRGILRNASISGAFIETALELPVFSSLAIVLPPMYPQAAMGLKLPACIVRKVLAGFAVEWRNMACPDIVSLVENASASNMARPPSVRSEKPDEGRSHVATDAPQLRQPGNESGPGGPLVR